MKYSTSERPATTTRNSCDAPKCAMEKSPRPASDIECAKGSLADAVNHLHKVISELTDKLDPVLSVQPPSPAEKEPKGNGATCGLHSYLLETEGMVRNATLRLEEINGRCRL